MDKSNRLQLIRSIASGKKTAAESQPKTMVPANARRRRAIAPMVLGKSSGPHTALPAQRFCVISRY